MKRCEQKTDFFLYKYLLSQYWRDGQCEHQAQLTEYGIATQFHFRLGHEIDFELLKTSAIVLDCFVISIKWRDRSARASVQRG